MIYIDENYNVWFISLIGASGKSASAPLLTQEKENKQMRIDTEQLIENAVEDAVNNRIDQAITNALYNLDLDGKIDELVAKYIEGCNDLINNKLEEYIWRCFE